MFCGTIYQVMYMDHKELINKYRLLGKVKGVKPAIVRLRTNKASLFNDPSGNFIMSIKGNVLYLQRLSVVFKKLMPNLDLQFNLVNFKEYQLINLNRFVCCLYLLNKKNEFIEIFFNTGTPETYGSHVAILRTIKEFEKIGITDIKVGEINEDEDVDNE